MCSMKKTPKKLLLILLPFDSMSLCQGQISVTVMVSDVSMSDVVPEARCSYYFGIDAWCPCRPNPACKEGRKHCAVLTIVSE